MNNQCRNEITRANLTCKKRWKKDPNKRSMKFILFLLLTLLLRAQVSHIWILITCLFHRNICTFQPIQLFAHWLRCVYEKNIERYGKYVYLHRSKGDFNFSVESFVVGEPHQHVHNPFWLIARCHVPCRRTNSNMNWLALNCTEHGRKIETHPHSELRLPSNFQHVWRSRPHLCPHAKCNVWPFCSLRRRWNSNFSNSFR